jgi:hypothetical protein
LELKQKNPGIICTDDSFEFNMSTEFTGVINAGNFPNYKDSICRSGGEFLCDPYEVMSSEERANITAAMERLRETTPISCPQFNYDKVDGHSFQPFYLGVAILSDWPLGQLDAESLQQLGQIVAAEWNMDRLYVGQTRPYTRCPDTGILLIFPDHGHAFLSSDSCQFVCESKGGPEVVAATLLALHSHGVEAAALAGINATYSLLAPKSASVTTAGEIFEGSYNPINALQRILFAVALGLLILSLIVGALVLWMAPGAIKELKHRSR